MLLLTFSFDVVKGMHKECINALILFSTPAQLCISLVLQVTKTGVGPGNETTQLDSRTLHHHYITTIT